MISNAWERLRTWLWWLEPRPQIRGGLRYGYERNWHRSRKWRARKAREHESLLEDFHRGVGSRALRRCGSGYICPGHAGYNGWFCDGEPE